MVVLASKVPVNTDETDNNEEIDNASKESACCKWNWCWAKEVCKCVEHKSEHDNAAIVNKYCCTKWDFTNHENYFVNYSIVYKPFKNNFLFVFAKCELF